MGPIAWRAIKKEWSRFGADTSGLTLIYVTIALPVIVGFALLAVDVGRLWSLHSSLQHGADALALAGAGELDRRTDSILRAEKAIDELIIGNSSIFEDTAGLVTITGDDVTTRYFSAIPGHGMSGSDADALALAGLGLDKNIADDNVAARFVEVRVDPKNFNTIFPASFLGASNAKQSSAMAVAGFDAAVCKFTPMFMCNPFEPVGNTDVMRSTEIFTHIASVAQRRKLIEFKRIGPTGQWSPGNYGFLEAPLGPGANALGETIATVSPSACFLQNGVYTKPGNTAVSKDAFNVRFDIYKGSYSRGNVNYRPAINVRKGYKAGGGGGPPACNKEVSTDPVADQVMGLRRDSCFVTGTCSYDNRIGNGDWDQDNDGTPDFEAYWALNHPTRSLPSGMSNTQLPSRYSVYRYEIENSGYVADTSPGGESGTPACYNGATPASDNPDRRILYGALMNCIAQPVASGNSGGPYIAVAFGKFFMTEPMDGPQDSLWVELVDVVDPGTANDVARDIVQLYR